MSVTVQRYVVNNVTGVNFHRILYLADEAGVELLRATSSDI